jgi:hypothetical protein
MRLVGWPFLSVGKDVAGGDIEACGVSFAELKMGCRGYRYSLRGKAEDAIPRFQLPKKFL